ncbi:MAG: signal peptidase I [Oscillospiraceae bacterium]|nr:signal peptidase I [Oscillospiraceae bacterium]
MKKFPIKDIYENCESIMVSLIVITLIIVFAFRAVSVDGDSMLPTLHHGERLITTNLFYTPEKGDIVVLDKNNELGKPLVKRVIATEGDTIRIDYTTGDVYVNGELLEESYILEKIEPVSINDIETTIKEGYVFVMGDNRNDSLDSRSQNIGQVNTKNILGKALFRIYPFDSIGGLY